VKEQLSTNHLIAHYRILSKLGVGGMGEVYLAEDTKLCRKIALKLLPAEFSRDAGRMRRFEQEARATIESALEYVDLGHVTMSF
jgi:serine/threonine protein kinase